MPISKYLARDSATLKLQWRVSAPLQRHKLPMKPWPYILKEDTNNLDFSNTGLCVGRYGNKGKSIL